MRGSRRWRDSSRTSATGARRRPPARERAAALGASGQPEAALPNWRDSTGWLATAAAWGGVPPRERDAKVEAPGLHPAPRRLLPTGNDMSLLFAHRPRTRVRHAPLTILAV